MADRFAVFILTHGRPNNVKTYDTLRRQGYSGDVYIIVDNEDDTIDEYRRNFGDKVIVFDKLAISKTFDTGDNFDDRRTVVYARNACWGIAESLGLDYFLQLDDDYIKFMYRTNADGEYPSDYWIVKILLGDVFEHVLNFYKGISAKSIALSQDGDFIGGTQNAYAKNPTLRRKCMNTFFCSIQRPFQFVGRINEDVNTYVWFQRLGSLFLTIPVVSVTQEETQSNPGGMSDLYLDSGTYIKSFYTVMYAPSCVDVAPMGSKYSRLHHRISWDNAVPKIVAEKYRKGLVTTP